MIWLILIVLAAGVAAWFYLPGFKEKVDGWKSRILALATTALGAAEAIDPNLVSLALGLDTKGKAYLIIGVGLAIWLFRELTKKPGALVRK